MVEELLAARGIIITYESVRQWAQVRSAFCQPDLPAPTAGWRQMASG